MKEPQRDVTNKRENTEGLRYEDTEEKRWGTDSVQFLNELLLTLLLIKVLYFSSLLYGPRTIFRFSVNKANPLY